LQYLMPLIAGVVAWFTLGETFRCSHRGRRGDHGGGLAHPAAASPPREAAQPG
jgi:hypothetical protein